MWKIVFFIPRSTDGPPSTHCWSNLRAPGVTQIRKSNKQMNINLRVGASSYENEIALLFVADVGTTPRPSKHKKNEPHPDT